MLLKNLFLTACALLVGINSYADLQESNSTGIRADYTHSPSTPDHIVYRRYVENVVQFDKLPDTSGVHFIQDTLSIVHDGEGLVRAEDAFTVFQSANSAIKSEIRSMEERRLCGEERAQRTRNDSYVAMDAVSDEREAISQRIYQQSLQDLDRVTREALLSELDEMKLSFVGKKRAHKNMYEETGADVFSVVDNLCSAFQKEAVQ